MKKLWFTSVLILIEVLIAAPVFAKGPAHSSASNEASRVKLNDEIASLEKAANQAELRNGDDLMTSFMALMGHAAAHLLWKHQAFPASHDPDYEMTERAIEIENDARRAAGKLPLGEVSRMVSRSMLLVSWAYVAKFAWDGYHTDQIGRDLPALWLHPSGLQRLMASGELLAPMSRKHSSGRFV